MKAEESTTPDLMDLFSPSFADDPHPAYHRMQNECPVQRSEGMFGGYSVNLSRYEDVMWAMATRMQAHEDKISPGCAYDLEDVVLALPGQVFLYGLEVAIE